MSAAHPPWSREAEQSVLGALMMDNGAIDRIPDLRAEQFFDGGHRIIFKVISGLLAANKPVDAITVFERVQASGELDAVGGLPYLNALSQAVPGTGNIERYAAIVADRSKSRALLAAGSEAMAAAQDHETPVDERIERVASGLMRLLEETDDEDATPLAEMLVRHTERIEERDSGSVRVTPTGLIDVDELLGGGGRPGNLIILAGRPGMGKTALALTIAMHMAGIDGVGFLSMEMSKEELSDRGVAMLGRIDLADVQRPPKGAAGDQFWSKLVEATEAAAGKRLFVDDRGGLTLAMVRAKARKLRRKHKIGVLVIDYLQLMSGTDPKAMRTYQLEEITRGLKALAKELGILVIALAQVKRTVDGLPGLSDLKDSGAIEQDADIVGFIHRPIAADPELPEDEWGLYAQLFIAKNRQGRQGIVSLAYVGRETRFGSWSGPTPQKKKAGKSYTKAKDDGF